MRILSKRTLREFWEKNSEVEQQLLSWYKALRASDCKSTNELLTIHPNCRSIGSHRYIFNIKGNSYRLVVKISFELQTLWIRFIGTHNDYDKIDPLKI